MRFDYSNPKSKWDLRFLQIAEHISTWSKDPSTKCGAVIVDRHRHIVSTGYNGFPRNMPDDKAKYEDRELKYKYIVHCEINAMTFAQQDLTNCTLYTYPAMSCSRCAGPMIQSGITRCVAPEATDDMKSRWGVDMEIATEMFRLSGVTLDIYIPEGSRIST